MAILLCQFPLTKSKLSTCWYEFALAQSIFDAIASFILIAGFFFLFHCWLTTLVSPNIWTRFMTSEIPPNYVPRSLVWFFSQLYWAEVCHCVSLECTMRWFERCIYGEVITSTRSVNIIFTSQNCHLLCVVRLFKMNQFWASNVQHAALVRFDGF